MITKTMLKYTGIKLVYIPVQIIAKSHQKTDFSAGILINSFVTKQLE